MLSTTVPANAFWVGPSFVPSLLDPMGTADLAAVGIFVVLVIMALLSYRFWVFRRQHAIHVHNHAWMTNKLEQFKQARRDGRQHEGDDLDFSPADVRKLEWDIRAERRHGHFFVAGLAFLGLLAALCIWVFAIAWANWWVEGGYQCNASGTQPNIVYNQLDPEGLQTNVLGQRVNLCSPGIFTQGAQFFANPKQAIREALY
ncbi:MULTISPECIES: hypothetical protein [Burkholderia]|uniref:hypothetical protein n=1 Tax=Burkholderia TaxID=32008 RepID=UPI001906B8A0|nr:MULTISPECIES: hypothetical protein [Burkholderia]MBJ9920697.1 hypothetical protein [Burkholderia cenocepacia]UVS90951.1 hypothetical protein EFP17_14920 [Burkholderia glumae]